MAVEFRGASLPELSWILTVYAIVFAATAVLLGTARFLGAERLQLLITSATGSSLLIAMIVLAVFKPSRRLGRAAQR